MDYNKVLLVFLILLTLTLISALLVGDYYLTQISFSSTGLLCENFDNTTAPAVMQTTTPTILQSTLSATQSQLQPKAVMAIPNSACIKLDKLQIGFARFKIVLFWVMFVAMVAFLVYALMNVGNQNLMIVLSVLGLPLVISILVGGIFLTLFVFNAKFKKCVNDEYYCYDLDETQIGFARLTSIFNWLYTVALSILIVVILAKTL